MWAASSQSRTTRSIPITATWMRGRAVTRRALPSFSTTQIVPVSATPRLTPEMPMSAAAKTSRSRVRACATSASRSLGSSRPLSAISTSRTCALLRWTAGATMWLGCWPASCRIHSPRSVSTTRRPLSSMASLSLISSVAIDFDFATRRAPRAAARSVM